MMETMLSLLNRYHRMLSDLDQSQTLQARLKADLDQSQRQCAQCQEKERQQSAKNRTLTAKLKSEKEEVRYVHNIFSWTIVFQQLTVKLCYSVGI